MNNEVKNTTEKRMQEENNEHLASISDEELFNKLNMYVNDLKYLRDLAKIKSTPISYLTSNLRNIRHINFISCNIVCVFNINNSAHRAIIWNFCDR